MPPKHSVIHRGSIADCTARVTTKTADDLADGGLCSNLQCGPLATRTAHSRDRLQGVMPIRYATVRLLSNRVLVNRAGRITEYRDKGGDVARQSCAAP